MAISAFRSNEARWKTDKVSFNLIGNVKLKNNAWEQVSRISQLTFVLTNDRIAKERLSTIIAKKSVISVIPEYNWLPDALNNVNVFMPDILSKGYFHVPTILPLVPTINIGGDMSADVEGLFVAGEASGSIGILYAALTGLIAADAACK
jgi:hypothetical protein